MRREPTCADEVANHWHKIAGILANKLGGDVLICVADIESLAGKSVVLSHQEGGTVLRVRVLDAQEAARLDALFQDAARRKR